MWLSRNKTDLIFEVWEKLDCESIGAAELDAIRVVLADQYGEAAVDSPMMLARMLADEGAELRHPEIMTLHLKYSAERPYDAALRNILNLDDLSAATASIRSLENLRQNYQRVNDREGLRLVRQTAIDGKKHLIGSAGIKRTDVNQEIASWLTIWLQTPEVFESWLALRKASAEFKEKFGDLETQ